jgi:hypothetical protein
VIRRLGARAASYTGEAPDPYSGDTGFEALAAHAGVTATGRPRDLKTRGLRVRIAPSAPMPGRLMAGQLALDQLIEVRVLARQRRQYVSHALVAQQARARLSYRRGRPFDPGQGLDNARQSGEEELPAARHEVLVLQLVERPARDAGRCGFESRRAHRARDGPAARSQGFSPPRRAPAPPPWRNWISAARLYREGCRFEPGRRLWLDP